MNYAEDLAIAAIIISVASTMVVFFERAALNRRIRSLEYKIHAIGTSLTR